MSTIPSRKGSSNADAKGSKTTSANSSRNRTFKKASSSSTLGSRTDSKLSQTSLSAFFAKVRPQDPSDEATFPASAPTPTISRQPSPFQSLVPNRTASANVPRKVIIEVSSEDEHVDQEPRRKTLGPSKPMKRLKVDKPKGSAMAVQSNSIAESRHRRKVPDIPGFVAAARGSAPSIMDDMPVSPPDNSTVSSTRRSPIRDDVVEGSSDKHELDSKPLHEAVDNDPLLSNLATTPQRDPASPANITPQRPGGKSSPFRTPTEESRHTLSTIESLGLSPQDSVFWARTPPSEALKKLERMNSGRSHEDEIASIVGRLYETSSAGAALRTMPQEPRDRIKEMLETIRGSSMTSRLILEDGQDDLDDTDELDPASPTKSLVERHRGISQNRRGLSRHFSAQELRTTGRRRGYTRPSLISDSPYSSQFNGPRSREDVLKMIEQMNSNMVDSPQSDEVDATGDVGSHNTSPSVKKTKSNDATSASGGEGASHKTTCLATLDVTPKTTPRTAPPPANSSPGEFDEFFTEMDEQDLEELTQLELSSASMTSTLPCSNVLSCPSSSLETCSTLCEVQKDKSGLDLKQSLQGSKSSGASNSSSSMNLPNEGPSSSDEFDDIGDLGYDFEDDTIINVRSPINCSGHP
ncbi:hypothetical protein B0O80DRAFT_16539 [Mortierella sp. GBAus27b]|nr:hypothetical protein B0O80DRAFT_16539 [Mortierella sp. GBAus27b]